MQTYVKQLLSVDAVQITEGLVHDALVDACVDLPSGQVFAAKGAAPGYTKVASIRAVATPDGLRQANVGDWIVVRGGVTRLYPDEAFRATFELKGAS